MRTWVWWLVPLLFALHNLEEWLALQTFLPRLMQEAPGFARHLPNVRQYGVALMIVTMIPLVFAILRQRFLLVVAQTVVAINVATHVVSAIVFRGYTPGVLTAVCLNLPFSIYFFRALRADGQVPAARMRRVIPIALLLHGPILIGLLWWLGLNHD